MLVSDLGLEYLGIGLPNDFVLPYKKRKDRLALIILAFLWQSYLNSSSLTSFSVRNSLNMQSRVVNVHNIKGNINIKTIKQTVWVGKDINKQLLPSINIFLWFEYKCHTSILKFSKDVEKQNNYLWFEYRKMSNISSFISELTYASRSTFPAADKCGHIHHQQRTISDSQMKVTSYFHQMNTQDH